MAAMAQTFIALTGPDNQMIQLNQHDIVSMRSPRRADHFAPGVRCVIFTSDGKFTLVVQECGAVIGKMHVGEH